MHGTKVQQFYAGKVILITGGTGFLGCYLVEKLLRSCPNVEKIYLMIRPKRGQNEEDRLRELLNNRIYNRLKQENPNSLNKLKVLKGDLELPRLGLDEHDLRTIIDEVSCIFHVGATVKFTEELRRAILINVGGTDSVVELAKRMNRLESLVHVSTAFSQGFMEKTKEIFYVSKENGDNLLELAYKQETKTLNELTVRVLDKWPNTYVFTKHVAEDLIRRKGSDLPIAIVRPSIVIAPYDVPLDAWSSVYDLNSLTLAAFNLGVWHSTRCKPEDKAEFIPVDFAVNHMLVVGWMLGTRKMGKIPIFHCVSGQQNPLTWSCQKEGLEKEEAKFPSVKKIFHRYVVLSTNNFVLQLVDLFNLPIIHLINLPSLVCGKTHLVLKTYRKIKKYSHLVEFATIRSWKFDDRNTQLLWKSLDNDDRKLFNFDVCSIDWMKMFAIVTYGVRVNLLQDDLSTLAKAKRKVILLRMFHYLTLFGYSTFVFAIVSKFITIFKNTVANLI